jgi:hypothetical protein
MILLLLRSHQRAKPQGNPRGGRPSKPSGSSELPADRNHRANANSIPAIDRIQKTHLLERRCFL